MIRTYHTKYWQDQNSITTLGRLNIGCMDTYAYTKILKLLVD